MYCPKCSQQQVSDEIRFCSSCGFQLDALKLLLIENQNNLAMSEIEPETQLVSTRKKDVLLGATAMLVAAISIILLMISGAAGTPWQAVVIPLLLVWTAIVSVILLSGHAAREVANLFSKEASSSTEQTASSLISRLNSATRQQALPPAQSSSVSGLGLLRVNTGDLAQPPSVTDRTTNLLSRKD
jgi:hypothetical protein